MEIVPGVSFQSVSIPVELDLDGQNKEHMNTVFPAFGCSYTDLLQHNFAGHFLLSGLCTGTQVFLIVQLLFVLRKIILALHLKFCVFWKHPFCEGTGGAQKVHTYPVGVFDPCRCQRTFEKINLYLYSVQIKEVQGDHCIFSECQSKFALPTVSKHE